MSRTYKDIKRWKDRHRDWNQDTVRINNQDGPWSWNWIQLPTTKPKRRKEVDIEWHWMTTPSWWVREYMTVPKRAACRNWEKTLVLETIEDADCPDYGRKPHSYYW